jgi:hypothetical protein
VPPTASALWLSKYSLFTQGPEDDPPPISPPHRQTLCSHLHLRGANHVQSQSNTARRHTSVPSCTRPELHESRCGFNPCRTALLAAIVLVVAGTKLGVLRLVVSPCAVPPTEPCRGPPLPRNQWPLASPPRRFEAREISLPPAQHNKKVDCIPDCRPGAANISSIAAAFATTAHPQAPITSYIALAAIIGLSFFLACHGRASPELGKLPNKPVSSQHFIILYPSPKSRYLSSLTDYPSSQI